MTLTQLESDLLRELVPGDWTLSDILRFVRTHHEADGESGRALVARWVARGWLETADAAPSSDQTRYWLGEAAYRDVPWLQPPPNGSLQRVEPRAAPRAP